MATPTYNRGGTMIQAGGSARLLGQAAALLGALALAAVLPATAHADFQPVNFRYQNVNRQALIGLPEGTRKTLVMPDASLKSGNETLTFTTPGGALSKQSPMTQSLLDGYLPMIQSQTQAEGVPLTLTAFAADLPAVGPCDVVKIAAEIGRSAATSSASAPLVLTARLGGPSTVTARRNVLLSGDQVLLAGVKGEGEARIEATSAQRAFGHLGRYGGAGRYWPGPGAGYDPAFDDLCIGYNGQPLVYRFRVEPGKDYTVALGFWENYWHEKGQRRIQIEVGGHKVGVVDTVNGGTKNTPMVVNFPAHANANGLLDVAVRAAPNAKDNNCILNAIWVFEGKRELKPAAVASGSLSKSALYYDNCGGPDDKAFTEGEVRITFPTPGGSAGGTVSAFLLRPWDLPVMRRRDLPHRLSDNVLGDTAAYWNRWLARAAVLDVPQRVCSDFYKASLINLMLMADRTKGGLMRPQPGATVYRGFWFRDGAYIVNALTYAGYFGAARSCLDYFRAEQDPDGAWDRPKTQWDSLGDAPWAFYVYWRLSGDRAMLREVYPQLLAGVKWTAQARAKDKKLNPDGTRPLTYGLLPPGFGDGGLPTAQCLHHDFWALWGEDITLDAAEELGKTADADWIRTERADFAQCIHDCVRRSFVTLPDGLGYIPPVPAETKYLSEWGNLGALYPSRFLAGDPYMAKTMAFIESREHEGLPMGLGYMSHGVWPYICCDVAKILLQEGHGDRAAAMYYAILNHAAPTRAWIEEIDLTTHNGGGDMPHGWAAANYIMLLRDLLAYEDGKTLRLAAGVPRGWLQDGLQVGVERLPTAFGPLTYRIQSQAARGKMTAEVEATAGTPIALHLRDPEKRPLKQVTVDGQPATDFDATGEVVRFQASGNIDHVEATFGG